MFGLLEQTQERDALALGHGSCLSCSAEFNLPCFMLSVLGLTEDWRWGDTTHTGPALGGIALLELCVEAPEGLKGAL